MTIPIRTAISIVTASGEIKCPGVLFHGLPIMDGESWLATFSNERGIQLNDMALLSFAVKSFENRLQGAGLFDQHLEFSHFTPTSSPGKTLRYVINITKLDGGEVEKIIRTGVGLLADIPEKVKRNPAYQRLKTIYDETGSHMLYGIGAEHTPDGSIYCLKTYWRFSSPIEELRILLSRNEKKRFDKLISVIQAFWPGWKSARLVGIDYLASGENRFKAYLPQKDFTEPLSIVTFCEFLLNLGWKVDINTFSKLSYFLLNRQTEIEPTAYSLGVAIGKKPSIKLEIAAKAYFRDTEETLNAVSALTESLGLDPSPLHAGVDILEKDNPFSRMPVIEVICLDFYPEGNNRVILYCRL